MTIWDFLLLGWIFGRRDQPDQPTENTGLTYANILITFTVITLFSLPFTWAILAWQGWGLGLSVVWYSALALIKLTLLSAVRHEGTR